MAVASPFATLLPRGVAVVEAPAGNPRALAELHPLEVPLIQDFASRRATEFAEGRTCARAALAQLDKDLADAPIGRDESRAPLWPQGIVGSISHSEHWRVAAVARRENVLGLGVDIEAVQVLERESVSALLSRRELQAARANLWLPAPVAEVVMFSAKEALYKVWNPLTGLWLGFEEARVRIRGGGRLDIDILRSRPAVFDRVQARWHADATTVRTAVWIAATASQA